MIAGSSLLLHYSRVRSCSPTAQISQMENADHITKIYNVGDLFDGL